MDQKPDDKSQEMMRYEERARNALGSPSEPVSPESGSAAVALQFRAPYLFYERRIREVVQPAHDVLEIGAGSGVHTGVLLDTGARVTATDISPSVLELLQRRLARGGDNRLTTRVADMEALPFEAQSFDTVVCAGSLSYGDPRVVDREILRVLRPCGNFISVDSLSHNPVYRFNRWVNYRRGQRTRSTLERMPTADRIEALARQFTRQEIRYFGSITWTMPFLMRMLGRERASRASDAFDRLVDAKRSAFKFVLVAEGRR